MTYNELKKQVLERFFSRANEMQKKAIFKTKGAVLIIAGAGSGKTTVLCNRIANLLLFGDAYTSAYEPQLIDEEVDFLRRYAQGDFPDSPEVTERLSALIGHDRATPWKILAVTFTNKAAGELKERLAAMNAPAAEVWASTFHSACVRILRRSIEAVGYNKNFVIYDPDDCKRIIKDILKDMNLSDKSFDPKTVLNIISRAKDKLITPYGFSALDSSGKQDYQLAIVKQIYGDYQNRLKAANALDFDDIIMKTVEALKTDPQVLEYWQKRFDYIMVDEYQDTNTAQYELVKLLAGGCGNLCVVGDEDQSIYRFRGATIENILSFEKEFDSAVIKLEQNYRSTTNILDAANAVIRNNTQHKEKKLWSQLGEGEKIKVLHFNDEQAEAAFVGSEILNSRDNGCRYSDNAVLYRNNAQSRTIELTLGKMGVPYKIVGGTKFYERKEIRDMIAYLSVICNPSDTVRLSRIINEPKRGIGDATWAEVERISLALGISPIETMERSDEFAAIAKKAKALQPVAKMFRDLTDTADERDITDILDDVMEQSGYKTMLMTQGDEGMGRLENIQELKSSMITFCEENESHTLFDFLEQVALISDLDSYDTSADKATLMTMHAAKGLEFNNVYIIGAEEGIFPSYRSFGDPMELEEDRRLCYVAITRAKRRLFITTAEYRLLYGQTQHNKPSRFIEEIPERYMEKKDNTRTTSSGSASQLSERTYGGRKQSTYLQERAASQAKASVPGNQSFSAGDRISHKKFGEGTVLSATPMGNDTLLEISFDDGGTKKLAAAFAKITKI